MAVDASEHFGSALVKYIPQLSCSDPTVPVVDITDLPVEMTGAIVTAHGKMSPNFAYVMTTRKTQERAQRKRKLPTSSAVPTKTHEEITKVVSVCGHLFDTGFINNILDLVEQVPGLMYVIAAS